MIKRAFLLLRTNPRLFGVRVVAHLRYYWLIARLGPRGLRLLNETHERDTRAEERYADWLSSATAAQPTPVATAPLLSVLVPVHIRPPTSSRRRWRACWRADVSALGSLHRGRCLDAAACARDDRVRGLPPDCGAHRVGDE